MDRIARTSQRNIVACGGFPATQKRLDGFLENRGVRFEQRNQLGLDGKEALEREERKHGLQQVGHDVLFLFGSANRRGNTKLGTETVIYWIACSHFPNAGRTFCVNTCLIWRRKSSADSSKVFPCLRIVSWRFTFLGSDSKTEQRYDRTT